MAVLVASAALAGAGATAANAGPHARSATVSTLTLRLGDQLHVTGTPLWCLVQKSNGIINFACFDGSLASPKPDSYALGIADKAADLGQVSASGQNAKVLTVVQEPSVSGPTFTAPSRKAHLINAAPTTVLVIGGTHVFCVVQKSQGVVNVTCALSTSAGKLLAPIGSYSVEESTTFAVIGKVLPKSKGGFKTVAAETQP